MRARGDGASEHERGSMRERADEYQSGAIAKGAIARDIGGVQRSERQRYKGGGDV